GCHVRCYTAKEVKLRQSKSAELRPRDPAVFGNKKLRSKAQFYSMIAVTVLIILGVAVTQNVGVWRKPAVDVPVPADLEKLDPQLRDYLRLQLKWVQKKPVDPTRQATLGIVYAANLLWSEARRCFSN